MYFTGFWVSAECSCSSRPCCRKPSQGWPSLAFPLLANPCSRSDREISVQEADPNRLFLGYFSTRGVSQSSSQGGRRDAYDSATERVAQGRDKVVTLVAAELPAGSRCHLKLLTKAETGSWLEPGSKGHLVKWVASHSLKRLTAQAMRTNISTHGLYHLSCCLRTDLTTFFPKLVSTVSISMLNSVDKLTICMASAGILFFLLSHTERQSNDQDQPQKITQLHNLT